MTTHRTRPARVRTAALVTALGVAAASALAAPAAAKGKPHQDEASTLGANVTIIDPSMTTTEIESIMGDLADQQRDAEMTEARHAVLFLPGEYGSVEDPLNVEVGYYTEVAGLGAQPGDVDITGTIEVYNRCLGDDSNPNCIALVNFWRTISNLHLTVETGDRGCRTGTNFWAVSQAVSMRRLDVNGQVSLMDYCTAGPQYASGGYIADSRFSGTVINGSQQQWLTRNSEVGTWSNAVWNQVFSGVEFTGEGAAPADTDFPSTPYTVLEETPLSREKPYLYVDAKGGYQVRVPDADRDTSGTSWGDGVTAGRSIALSKFYVATPDSSVRDINLALARGKHLLLTPGVYDIDRSILVTRPNTVVLGLGHATLTAVDGATPLKVSDAHGIVIAGVTIDAGEELSETLLQVGSKVSLRDLLASHLPQRWVDKIDQWRARFGDDPITLSDVYFRVGGPHVGKTETALEINADNVLVDHTWVWRADHGVEGFTEGVNGDTDRWETNTGTNGVVVNGDAVTATGLFVEHFQEHNTIWNGEGGTVVLYQNELPYDPPTQADWTEPDGTLGWAGYKVADDVRSHSLYGGGVYVFNQNNPSIVTENGFEVPETPGVTLHHIMTVNLSAGTINHVVNGVGDAVPPATSGAPEYLADYPAP
ncbi:glycosyl hydrolase family 28-related protein [Demequina sp. NBRC 110057]|uniref:glycosyl hydrolase family 28-related protein n=1 Tax=Demequina sp. NBRC 110057 TaxID=1570346 RepID=UPI0009FE913C|nr:glycosyl hydrolase family 28-related protein [Demequina sp. NBRC 110057]